MHIAQRATPVALVTCAAFLVAAPAASAHRPWCYNSAVCANVFGSEPYAVHKCQAKEGARYPGCKLDRTSKRGTVVARTETWGPNSYLGHFSFKIYAGILLHRYRCSGTVVIDAHDGHAIRGGYTCVRI